MIHYYRHLFVKMKVFNCSELHFAEVTFYKIHTLVKKLKFFRKYLNFLQFSSSKTKIIRGNMVCKFIHSYSSSDIITFSSGQDGIGLSLKFLLANFFFSLYYHVTSLIHMLESWFQILGIEAYEFDYKIPT